MPSFRAVVALALAGMAGCRGAADAPRRGFWYPDEGRVVDLTRPASRAGDAGESGGARATTLITGLELAAGSAVGATIDQIEPGRCVAPLIVIDVRERADQAPEFVYSAEDLAEFEARHGEIPSGALVVLATGGGRRAGNAAAPARLLHAGFSPGVVELLVRQRGAVGLATDAPALDPSTVAVPEAMRSAVALGAFVITNLARLDQLPEGRAILLLTPPPTASRALPVRVFALTSRTVGRASR